MASIQSIRGRINGISKTRQITRSMRQISYAKVQQAQQVYSGCLPYSENVRYMMDALSLADAARTHPVFAGREVKKTGIIAISTDRGLCGAYNLNIARRTARLAKKKPASHIITLGKKCEPILRREGAVVDFSYLGISEVPILEEAQMLAAQLLELYSSGSIDEIYVVYTRFISMLEQQVTEHRLLPYSASEGFGTRGAWAMEPDEDELIDELTPVYLGAVLYHTILESALCEQSARISSMDAAARNSDELLEKLTLEYNKLRQEGITNQLIEIVGGAAAKRE